eukprot:PITA_20617
MSNANRLAVIGLFLASLHLFCLQPSCSMRTLSQRHAMHDSRGEKNMRDLNSRLPRKLNDIAGRVIVVAKEKGNGDFTTVQDAINAVPANNTNSILILVKPGIYNEKVTIPEEKPFIILSGSGANNTVITWNDSAKASGGTYYCATVSVFASDFIARYITIQNSYGPGDQAVALRISGDRSAFYGCRFLGYQDTVLDESGKHYFSNCFIEGAADFICGDGQSLYERCHLHTIPELNGAITAQRRSTPGENTGYTFLSCKITGGGLMYLGRAWGRYSRVVFAFTYIADIIFPEGWDNWNDPTRESTVVYGLYKCSGPGATNKGRVSWSHELSDEEAAPFLSRSFIDGDNWIKNMPSNVQRATNLPPQQG